MDQVEIEELLFVSRELQTLAGNPEFQLQREKIHGCLKIIQRITFRLQHEHN